MNREKRLALILAAALGALLLICTVVSQQIYDRLLPRVQIVTGSWQEEGFVLPSEALFKDPQGDCVYYMEEKQERSGSRYVVRTAYVTVLGRDDAAGTVTVRGIYNPDWVYAAGSEELSDGLEVKPERPE